MSLMTFIGQTRGNDFSKRRGNHGESRSWKKTVSKRFPRISKLWNHFSARYVRDANYIVLMESCLQQPTPNGFYKTFRLTKPDLKTLMKCGTLVREVVSTTCDCCWACYDGLDTQSHAQARDGVTMVSFVILYRALIYRLSFYIPVMGKGNKNYACLI